MSNTLLTPTAVTRACLAVLHQNLNFIGNINRQYDDSYAVEGAKIGSALKIRLPNRYTYGTGSTLNIQQTIESSTTLNVTTQGQVGMQFTSADLTMSLQDFTMRIIEPAIKVLASGIENTVLAMVNTQVYNAVDNHGTSITMATVLQGRKILNDNLAPMDGNRTAVLNTQDSADIVNALKTLFHASDEIEEQYREGKMGRTGGFDFYENTLLNSNTSGTTSATNLWAVNTSLTVSSTAITSMNINGGSGGTWAVGDIFTVGTTALGLTRCHPETKVNQNVLQQFIVTAAVGSATSVTSISFQPGIVLSGGAQNVIPAVISTALLNKLGNTSYVYNPSVVFHRDAFTFATADLIMPRGVHFAGREVQDGISMRIVQQYDIRNDVVPCRVDVLYGYAALYPQWAVQLLNN